MQFFKKRQPQKKPGTVYFSEAICKHLIEDPDYMQELLEAAKSVMTRRGKRRRLTTPNKLLQKDESAIQERQGLFWYELTSSHGRITIAGDAESGDVYNMKSPEFERLETVSFIDLYTFGDIIKQAREQARESEGDQ